MEITINNKEYIPRDEIIYWIDKFFVQERAKEIIRRKLTEEEIIECTNFIESGLSGFALASRMKLNNYYNIFLIPNKYKVNHRQKQTIHNTFSLLSRCEFFIFFHNTITT